MNTSQRVLLAAVGLAGALTAGAAMAHGRDDIQWSVTIGAPVGTPVYTAPVYTAPAPVYTVPAPVYTAPAPVYATPAYPRHYQRPTWWDRDGDGIPNRYDRVYNPRWDRDGDGVADWRERHDGRYGWRR